MTARRFSIEIAGERLVGLAFGSDAELESFLAGRGLSMAERPAPAPKSTTAPTVKVGRRNMDAVIHAAIRAVAVDDASKSATARAIQRHIAAAGALVVPSERSITRRLATRSQSDKMLDKTPDKIRRVR